MADVFDFYVKDNRTIQFKFTEPIMLEDSHVTDWVFHIPRILNNIDVSGWTWWLVYINARGQKYSELLELSEDPESPLEKCIATYSVDYGMSIRAGVVRFSLEAINADTQGTILNEWHTQTYQAKVQDTLQGNQVEYAETESDIISALIVEVQNKVSQLVGGATPEPKSLIADMTDTKKVYLYVGEESGESTNYWYYYNGSAWVAGGLYASGIAVDSVPTQGSSNAVSSGGVWEAVHNTDVTLTHSGQPADAGAVRKFTEFNTKNLLANATRTDITFRGITYAWTDESCEVSGEADIDNASFITLAGSSSTFPAAMEPGGTYHVRYSGLDVSLFFVVTKTGSSQNTAFYADGDFTIPDDAVGLEIRLRVAAGTEVDETVSPQILNAYTNKEIDGYITEIHKETSNLLTDITQTDSSGSNVAWQWNSNGSCTVSTTGTASATAVKNIAGGTAKMPENINAGETYHIEFTGTDAALGIVAYKNGSATKSELFFGNGEFAVPADATGVEIRFRVQKGDAANETIYPPVITLAETNQKLTQDVNGIRDAVTDISKNNSTDLLLYKTRKTENLNGIWFKWSGYACAVKGTATAATVNLIAGSSSAFPTGMEAGGTYYVKHTSANVALRIRQYKSGGTTKDISVYDDTAVKLDYDAVGAEIALRVASGATVNETVSPQVHNAYTNEELTELVEAMQHDTTSNILTDIRRENATLNDVTWHWNADGTCTVKGTSTDVSLRTLIGSSTVLPDIFTPGETYYIQYESINVGLHILAYDENEDIISSVFFYTSDIYSVPPETAAMQVRIRVGSGVTVDETVLPKITKAFTNQQLTEIVTQEQFLANAVLNCAKSYMPFSDTDFFTYGENSATKYSVENPRQIHCGCLTELIIGGCPFYLSRYVGLPENALYSAGYGFDVYAHSLALALDGDADEIAAIGSENLSKTINELKRLELYKASFQICQALYRWGWTFEILEDGHIDNSRLQIGDIVFYGVPIEDPDSPANINGWKILHCDVIVGKKAGRFYVADGGSMPIRIHPLSFGTTYQYIMGGRVPLKYNL